MNNSVKQKNIALILWLCTILLFLSGLLFDFTGETLGLVFPYYFLVLTCILSGLALSYYLYIAVSAYCYHPAQLLSLNDLPGCTVIVPAYNEGPHVAETLNSILSADYPQEKLEIIAIDDGSADDTLYWIEEVSSRNPGRITVIHFPRNQGKKHGLYTGFLKAKYDIAVTVDSDTILESGALQQIVSGFSDPEVGSVAGNIRIRNLNEGILPRMMDVGFMFGFEVIRCAQSLIGCVMCTPGAFSAYRRSLLFPFLDKWMKQKFLGIPATTGEDRALATMMICSGKKVVFQRDAVAHTCIPSNYTRFCKMLLRWTRSDIRENAIIFIHAFKKLQCNHIRIGLQYHALVQWINTLIPGIFPLAMIVILFFMPLTFFALLYCGIFCSCVAALIPAFIYAKRVSGVFSVWGIFFAIYNTLLLSWIVPYSFITVKNSGWLTRDLQNKNINRGKIQKIVFGVQKNTGHNK